MSSFLKKNKDLFFITFFTPILFVFHCIINNHFTPLFDIPLISIYLFNYFVVLFFLIGSRLNIYFHLLTPLTFFIFLTFIKMVLTVIFFLYLAQNSDYSITIVVYHFFPLYFILLSFEIISLKKTLNKI